MLYRLKNAGFQAYLVGGGVRDLLLGREPKDFDVVTNASPEQVRGVFRNCRLIGRRFRLAHVHFGSEIIEVATFRSMQDVGSNAERSSEHNGMLLRDNVYGTIEEDVLRRDFTVNALYYNIDDFSVIDYVGGLQDLEQGTLRLLGEPHTRYREDPVRMLRAVRFAAKLGFKIDQACEHPMRESGALLAGVPAARLFDESLKLFMGGTAVQSFEKLRHYDLFSRIFPETDRCLSYQEHEFPITFVMKGMENTDIRISEGKPVTPAFLFAVLLWEPVRRRTALLVAGGMPMSLAIHQAGGEVVAGQIQHVSIPRRYTMPMREIWNLQHRLENPGAKRSRRLLAAPRFRAGYDFLLLRALAGEVDQELADWWTRAQENNEPARSPELPGVGDKPRRGRRRRRKRPESSGDR